VEVGPGDILVNAPLRIDERILHFLAGVSYTDERLQFVTTSYRPSGTELSAEHRAIAQRMAALCTAAAAGGEPSPAIQLLREDDAGLHEIPARAFQLRGLDMRIIHAHEIPHAAADRQLLTRVWQREAALAKSGLLVVLDDTEQSEIQRAVVAFVERADVVLVLAGREPLQLPGHPLPRFDVK